MITTNPQLGRLGRALAQNATSFLRLIHDQALSSFGVPPLICLKAVVSGFDQSDIEMTRV